MKIKSIIASIVAAGTLALSAAAAFADEPVANDVLADPSAADEIVAAEIPDDIVIAPNPEAASVTAEDVYAKAKSYFATALKAQFDAMKAEIAAAGGAEAYTEATMKALTPEAIEGFKAQLIAMAVQNGADEAEITKSLEPITAEAVQALTKEGINLVAASDSADALVDNTLTYGFDTLKAGIEAAGGVDAFADAVMAEITEQQLSDIKAALAANGAATTEDLEALTKDSLKETVKQAATMVESVESVDEIFINTLSIFGDEGLAAMSAMIDEQIAALENQNLGGETPDIAPAPGENPDTGVESVATIVGVIAVAGAVVVISRKKV